jgi:hypothetical protein
MLHGKNISLPEAGMSLPPRPVSLEVRHLVYFMQMNFNKINET